VDKQVLATIGRGNEPIPLLIVEPLYFALRHRTISLFLPQSFYSHAGRPSTCFFVPDLLMRVKYYFEVQKTFDMRAGAWQNAFMA
jgi:hypothetical protein